MPFENPTVQEVEAVLRDARTGKKQTPSDGDLFPVYNYVFPAKDESIEDEASASSSSLKHFYCSKCPSTLHREAATYLLFLFAFRRDGMPKRFLGELERTFDACTGCSRAFGGIRRRFGTRYVESHCLIWLLTLTAQIPRTSTGRNQKELLCRSRQMASGTHHDRRICSGSRYGLHAHGL